MRPRGSRGPQGRQGWAFWGEVGSVVTGRRWEVAAGSPRGQARGEGPRRRGDARLVDGHQQGSTSSHFGVSSVLMVFTKDLDAGLECILGT